MSTVPDVIVIGAGAAGLTAAIVLGRRGLSVTMFEARDRIGGRMFTQRDQVLGAPIEYGAEFIHGLAPEIWEPLQSRKIAITEVEGDSWCSRKAQLAPCDFFSQVDDILKKMNPRDPDESFLSFLDRHYPDSPNDPARHEARQHALAYVSGFNAADPDRVGVHWLVQQMRAEERTGGDRAFRSQHGYEDLLNIFSEQLSVAGVRIQTQTVVDTITWHAHHANIAYRTPNGTGNASTARVLVTIPLSLLQSRDHQEGTVHFIPDLSKNKREAMTKLEMGKVIRITLRFRDRFWDALAGGSTSKTLSNMSFLFSDRSEDCFPTWWTTMPEKLPLIVGWAPFRSGEQLSGKNRSFVIGQALQSLGRLLNREPRELSNLLKDAYFHDWQTDPFSRGAYSYGAVGSDRAAEELGSPMEDTLFFAGEATDTSGHTGTVQGAIASGQRAANEILAALHL